MKRRGHGEGSIHRRKDGRWVGICDLGYADGKRKRKYVYGRTRSEALQKLRAVQHAKDSNLALPNDAQTVEQFLNCWINEIIEPSDLKPATKQSYKDNVRLHLVPAMGKVKLSKLTPQDVQRLVATKEAEGKSPRTIQIVVAILRTALAHALLWGDVSRNVAALVRVCKPTTQAVDRALTTEQMRLLLAAAEGDRLYPLIVVMGTTGLRKGEALGLQWDDIDLERGVLTVSRTVQRIHERGLVIGDPKTRGSERAFELAPQVVTILQAHRRNQRRERLKAGSSWTDSGFVFPSTVGTVMEPRNLNRHVHRLCEKAGIPKSRVHDLRHTTATIARSLGFDTKAVQEMLGHTRLATTADVYTHVPAALERDAATILADALLG